VIPGNGTRRIAIGMSGFSGIGTSVWGAHGNIRQGASTSVDGGEDNFATYDPNGKIATFNGLTPDGTFKTNWKFDANGVIRAGSQADINSNFIGTFANDASGINRQVSGVNLDGSYSFQVVSDAARGNEVSMYAKADGSVSGANTEDANGIYRIQEIQSTSNSRVILRDSFSNILGTVP